MLYYQKLDVYKCSIEFLAIVSELIHQLDRKESALKDQLKRAALSVPLNIAESCGKVTTADKAKFLAIARGSAMECGACLDCLLILRPDCLEKIQIGNKLVQRVVEMLSKMCR